MKAVEISNRNEGNIGTAVLSLEDESINLRSEKGRSDSETSTDSFSQTPNPRLYPSSKDEDMFYLFGVIDYFQLYDYKKMIEKYFKKLMKCNPRLDTSSQPPKYYAMRFEQFVEGIMDGGSDANDTALNQESLKSIRQSIQQMKDREEQDNLAINDSFGYDDEEAPASR